MRGGANQLMTRIRVRSIVAIKRWEYESCKPSVPDLFSKGGKKYIFGKIIHKAFKIVELIPGEHAKNIHFRAQFQILADSDIYWQHRIGFWGTWYDISPIISTDINEMADTINIDDRYFKYWFKKLLTNIKKDTDTKILNHDLKLTFGWFS